MITFGSLFAGIGGFDAGFEEAGLECRWQVENDKDANRVLAHHWPEVRRYPDVRHFPPSVFPSRYKVDVICGGFPCQDLSVAGKREGIGGERSGLFFQMARIVDELQPKFVIFENVPGLFSSRARQYATERCVCGWDFGWGGLLVNRDKQEKKNVRLSRLRGNDRESDSDSAKSSKKIRRNFAKQPKANEEVGSSLDVAGVRKVGPEDVGVGLPTHGIKGQASESLDGFGKHEVRNKEFLDGREETSGCFYSGNGPGLESQGSDLRLDSSGWNPCNGEVCPGCGRFSPGATREPRLVQRSDMATVVRTFRQFGYFGGWRVLDSQYFGVAQRRRRIFGVFARGDIGVGRAAEILAFTEGGGGDSEAGEEARSRAAGTLRGRSSSPGVSPPGRGGEEDQNLVTGALGGNGGPDDNDAQGNRLIYGTLNCGSKSMGGFRTEPGEHLVTHALNARNDPNGEEFLAFDKYNQMLTGEQGCTIGAGSKKHNNAHLPHVVHTLKSEGHDANEDGTGRGVPLTCFDWQSGGDVRLNCSSSSSSALQANQVPAVHNKIVRRLTPLECTRLQGFADNWLDLSPPLSDSAKYRLLGNAVTRTVGAWLGRRIAKLSK